MTLMALKQALQVALTFFASTHLAPALGLDGLNDRLPFTIPISLVLLLFLLVTMYLERRRRTRQDSSNQMFAQATLALFKHSMVSFSNLEGKLSFANENLLRATQFEMDELVGKSDRVLFPLDERDRFDKIKSNISSGSPWQGEIQICSKSGKPIWASATIMPFLNGKEQIEGYFLVCSDITNTKVTQTQKTIFEALETLQDQVLVLDLQSLEVCYMNRAAIEFSAVTGDSYVGKTPSDLSMGYSDSSFRQAIAPVIEGEKEFVELPARIGSRDFELRVQAIDNLSATRKLMIVMIDLTAWKEAERQKTEFVSNVSHELRTPMTSIKGAVGLILAGSTGEVPPKARKMLEIAHRNVDRLVNLINDLLDLEKLTAKEMVFEFAPVNVGELLREAALATEGYANRFDVTICMENVSTRVIAEIDSDRTLQVLTNLLSNAIKFSKPGGQVELTLEATDTDFTVEVQDHGDGIAPERQKDIFCRFSQIGGDKSSVVRGTGLGLSIVKEIVNQQGGQIFVESALGVGSRFSVVFPLKGARKGTESLGASAA